MSAELIYALPKGYQLGSDSHLPYLDRAICSISHILLSILSVNPKGKGLKTEKESREAGSGNH